MSNELELFNGQQEKWYSIKELASLCGLQEGSCKNIILHLKSMETFQNDSIKYRSLGYRKGTEAIYSENILKAIKQYQLRNSAPNALKNKETAIEGNVSMAVNQTIASILNNPKALTEFALQASQKLLEAQPKIEWYDNVAASENLTEIGTVGKMTGIGEKKIFKTLMSDEIIRKKADSDGIKYYVPNFDYEKYFKIIPEPFPCGDKMFVRNKLLFNQEGVIWATKRYSQKKNILALKTV